MTAKIKRAPQRRLSWWNEFLFTRPFDIETTLSVDECAERLRGLAEVSSSFLTGKRSVTAEVYFLPDTINFYIRVKDCSRSGIKFTTTRAEGSLAQNPETGLTLSYGIIKFGWFYYIGWLLAVVQLAFIVLGIPPFNHYAELFPLFGLWLILIAASLFSEFRSLFSDRNKLIRSIQDALDPSAGKPKRKRS